MNQDKGNERTQEEDQEQPKLTEEQLENLYNFFVALMKMEEEDKKRTPEERGRNTIGFTCEERQSLEARHYKDLRGMVLIDSTIERSKRHRRVRRRIPA